MQDEYSARECPSPVASSTLSSIPPSPSFTQPAHDQLPYTPTTLSTLSLDDDELILPSYDAEIEKLRESMAPEQEPDTVSDASAEGTLHIPAWSCHTQAADDTSVEEEPSRHVDYLSHEWREEDIWASWRYVTARKDSYSNGVRLENASWRTWAKAKNNLGTISPETLNWYVSGLQCYLCSLRDHTSPGTDSVLQVERLRCHMALRTPEDVELL
jgi:hypothetical protein